MSLSSPSFAIQILKLLIEENVRHFVICPGGRNAPFVEGLEILAEKKLCTLWTHFEERSAAFFALGLAATERASRVAVITTSGTAAAELLPAVIEAHYQGLPMVFVTADRPRRYRPFGTPQAIRQVNLFGDYVGECLDVDADDFDLSGMQKKLRASLTLHLNICFDDPLTTTRAKNLGEIENLTISPIRSTAWKPEEVKSQPQLTIEKYRDAAIIISGLHPDERTLWQPILAEIGCPQVFESSSGLQNNFQISEATMIRHLKAGDIQSVVRLGGTPTSRVWRDLEESFADVNVLSLTSNPYAGLARSKHDYFRLTTEQIKIVSKQILFLKNSNFEKIRGTENRYQSRLEEIKKQFPNAEQNVFAELSEQIQSDPLYLGNSLPIRRYGQFAVRTKMAAQNIFANRGANGIDGQLASYLGWSYKFEKSWCILGDLTTLYDLAAFWSVQALPSGRRNLIIINNHGGKIFEPMFRSPLFLNAHALDFSKLAEFWKVAYTRVDDAGDLTNLGKANDGLQLIEVIPDPLQTQDFHKQMSAE